jgi:hypothetical protein
MIPFSRRKEVHTAIQQNREKHLGRAHTRIYGSAKCGY